MIPDLTDCQNKRAIAVAAGAAMNGTGLDTALPLPRGVHWAVGGAGVSYYCGNTTMEIDQELIMLAMLGYAGGFAFQYLKFAGIFG